MAKVTLIGHSYIRRLESAYESRRFSHRGPADMQLQFVGIGGGKVTGPMGPKNLFGHIEQIRRFGPDIIFVHAGENDLQWFHPFEVRGG